MSRLAAVLTSAARHEVERRSFIEYGVVTSVFDSGDDAQSATVQLRDSGEVLPRVPVAVAVTGLAALPRIGDVVLVAFPGAQLASPVVIAQAYSDARRPPAATADQVRLVWPGDTDDAEGAAVELVIQAGDNGRELRLGLGGDDDATLTLSPGQIELASGGVGVRLGHGSASDGTIEMVAGGTRIQLGQDGDLTIASATKVSISAPQIELEADVSVKIQGQTLELN